MVMLARLKNEGHSWRSLAEEINERIEGKPVSHNMIRRVALGHCKSARIDYALGVREKPPPIPVEPCPVCGQVHERLVQCEDKRRREKRTKAHGWTRPAFWVSPEEQAAYDEWMQREGVGSLQELARREMRR